MTALAIFGGSAAFWLASAILAALFGHSLLAIASIVMAGVMGWQGFKWRHA